MPFLRLKKKQKVKPSVTGEEVRTIVREEIGLSVEEQKKLEEEEKKKLLIRKRINALPQRTKLKFLRYLKAKEGEKHGKK